MTQLHALRQRGIEIAIDDFGTGYSSLSYLKSLPIDTLKIDKSFIRDIPDDRSDMAIAAAIVAMARQLRLKTLAEGVETVAQADFLKQVGCRLAQGYLFSRPIPSDEVASFIERKAEPETSSLLIDKG
ncbi:EAL domain-containing protein [Rhabdochromatium marinum]|uniref:EAL domain-containing protein n=1 Tax=Rhabdochromatium marinum TaxID=48729 RepID=UPI00190793DC|nr:hypothetical protein [Rhabdochromatium marinum]